MEELEKSKEEAITERDEYWQGQLQAKVGCIVYTTCMSNVITLDKRMNNSLILSVSHHKSHTILCVISHIVLNLRDIYPCDICSNINSRTTDNEVQFNNIP